MSDYLRLIAGGSLVGLLAGLLALPSLLPPALADEEPAKTLLSTADELFAQPIDLGNLVKYDFTIEPSVSTDVVKTRTVRKIGYGRTEFVEIYTTPTGTYSSDGLTSPHVRYPGIHKEPKRSSGAHIAFWSGGDWSVSKPVDAGSVLTITPLAGGTLITTGDGSCVMVKRSVRC